MQPLSRDGRRKTRNRSARYGAVAAIVALTFAVGGHGTAWADTAGTTSQDKSVTTSESATGATDTGAAAKPKTSTTDVDAKTGETSSPSTPDATKGSAAEGDTDVKGDTDKDTAGATPAKDPTTDVTGDGPASPIETGSSPDPKSTSAEPEQDNSKTAASTAPSTSTKPTHGKEAAGDSSATATVGALDAKASASSDDLKASTLADPINAKNADPGPSAKTKVAFSVASAAAVEDETPSTAAVVTTPIEPAPLSPIAKLVALPGQIVNAVLQVLGITTSAALGPSPISPAPFADLFFAVFRRVEEAIGLDKPVSVPTPPSLTYTGPATGDTPTVTQFLNAATTEYVLGGAPAGLKPLTVDGWQMSSLHELTGETAKVWVTPEKQIIIAYSGTTGGTNLLFNPLIAISQLLTDFQAGFSNTTPKAFDQALDFAKEVQAEAAEQGYAPDSVFVTGHSLGAWEAQYVAQQIGLPGIGFEGPGLSTTVDGNGKGSMFVNTATYGDMAAYLSSDLPGLYPVVPYTYVPSGGEHPHYGPIVLLGDPTSNTPMTNAAQLYGKGLIGTLVGLVDLLGNFFASHLPGVQAYNLGVDQDPGVVPWLGIDGGIVHDYGNLTIPEFLKAASDDKILVTP